MSNLTARDARTIHGTDPQNLIEKVILERIYLSNYWNEECFALTAESIIDRAVQLDAIGGTFGLQKATPFLCLVLKLLQLQPDKDILLEYLKYEELKYLRAVAAMYIRLTFSPLEIYEVLEPMLNDYRKLRFRQRSGDYSLTYMDEYIDELLTQERVCELILPRMKRRDVLEEIAGLAPRVSKLEDALLTLKGDDADGLDSDASDESTKEMLRQRRLRVERAQKVRAEIQATGGERARLAFGREDSQNDAELGTLHVTSQSRSASPEGSYVSRSPSRSPDRVGYISRSPSRSPDRAETVARFVSRSPTSQSPNGNGYVSRSPSRSPDRE